MQSNPRKAQDPEMQAVWLGTLLKNTDLIAEAVIDHGDKDLMHGDSHSAIWKSISELYQENKKVDPMSISSHIRSHGYLSDRDLELSMGTILPLGGGAGHMDTWTEQLVELFQWREAKKLALDMQQMAGDSNVKFEKLIDEVNTRLNGSQGSSKPALVEDVVQEMVKEMQAGPKLGIPRTGLMTGFYEIDQAIGGFEDDDFVGLAARPKNGKTAAALQMTRNILMEEPEGAVVWFSLEMSPERLVRRCVSALSGVDYLKIRANMMTADEQNRVYAAYKTMEFLKDRLVIFTMKNFPGGFTADKIIQATRGISMRRKVLLTIVDNFQRLPARDLNELNAIARNFKNLAGLTMHPNMMLLQIGRIQERENRPPKMSDIKDCGQVEQELDRLMMIDRPDLRNEHIPQMWEQYGIIEGLSQWSLPKNRDGGSAFFNMMFHGPTMQFVGYNSGVSGPKDITLPQSILPTEHNEHPAEPVPSLS